MESAWLPAHDHRILSEVDASSPERA